MIITKQSQAEIFTFFSQSQLGDLVGQSSGYMESLPAEVRRRIRALKKLQVFLLYTEFHEISSLS